MHSLLTALRRHPFRNALAAFALACLAVAWRDTMADPVVHQTEVDLPGLVADMPPLRVLLMSDLHVIDPEMPPARLARIVAQVNALRPDLVVIAGDFISDRLLATGHYAVRDAVAPLAGLRAPLGTIAVLGNHDHWRSASRGKLELARIGVTVLTNNSVRRGPLIIGGLDDYGTQHDNSLAMMKTVPPGNVPLIVVSHNPDVFQHRTFDVPLVLAGHFHCGQIGWPWGGTPAHTSDWDDRFSCGRSEKDGRTLIVTAGLGNSVLPFRLFIKPDMWLVTVRPQR